MDEKNNSRSSCIIKVELSPMEYHIYNLIAKDLYKKDVIKEPILKSLIQHSMVFTSIRIFSIEEVC